MIEVVDHDPAWAARFEVLRQELDLALTQAGVPVLAIEHVGSTAVPGLAGKPVVDCDVVVSAGQVAWASEVLVGLGFRALGELGIAQRWAFAEPARLAGTNTYVTVEGCLALRNHLAARDVLRADPELRERYGVLKKRVGASAATVEEYGRGKDSMLQEILEAAGFTASERESVAAAQPHRTSRAT